MNKLNLPPFYVGQKVVSIFNHPQGDFKKGDVFKVLGIKKRNCCGNFVVDIGIKRRYLATMCICGCVNGFDTFYSCTRFKPLEEMNAPLLTFQQIKEAEKEEVLILN